MRIKPPDVHRGINLMPTRGTCLSSPEGSANGGQEHPAPPDEHRGGAWTKQAIITILMVTLLFGASLFSSGCCCYVFTRESAVNEVTKKWAAALKNKDEKAYLSFIDKNSLRFYRQQKEIFTNLLEVPFANVKMEADSNFGAGVNPLNSMGRFVVKIKLSYTFKDSFKDSFDEVERYIAFRQVDGKWKAYQDATEEYTDHPLPKGILALPKMKSFATGHFIILSPEADQDLAQEISTNADSSYGLVGAQFKLPSVKTPILVCRDYDQIVEVVGRSSQISPWSTAMASRPAPNRNCYEIIVNAQGYQELEGPDRKMVITHEIVHLGLEDSLTDATPSFLREGAATYFAGGTEVYYLKAKLRANSLSVSLDDLVDPSGIEMLESQNDYELAYEESYTAVDFIGEKYGNQKITELLKGYKEEKENLTGVKLTNAVFSEVLGVSWEQFKVQWLDYVRTLPD